MGTTKKNILAQSLGVDVSKKNLACCICYLNTERQIKIKATRSFLNTFEGFKKLHKWLNSKALSDLSLSIVMEATGVYYEELAYYFSAQTSKNSNYKVSVLLPNRSKAFAKSLNIKSKTDKIDAALLARMGAERNLPVWNGLRPEMYLLRKLCREREMLVDQRTMTLNRLHALEHGYDTQKSISKRTMQMKKFADKLITEVEKEIFNLIESDEVLKANIARLKDIPGISFLSAAIILSETNNFELFKNKEQLVSYAGLDVVENQSGSSLKGKTRISKKGNGLLRKVLYFPALAHIRCKSIFYNSFMNILGRCHFKMKAYVAVQRKMLVLCYVLVKNQTTFDPLYHLEDCHTRAPKKIGSPKTAYTA